MLSKTDLECYTDRRCVLYITESREREKLGDIYHSSIREALLNVPLLPRAGLGGEEVKDTVFSPKVVVLMEGRTFSIRTHRRHVLFMFPRAKEVLLMADMRISQETVGQCDR
jgi:hypothetical protein